MYLPDFLVYVWSVIFLSELRELLTLKSAIDLTLPSKLCSYQVNVFNFSLFVRNFLLYIFMRIFNICALCFQEVSTFSATNCDHPLSFLVHNSPCPLAMYYSCRISWPLAMQTLSSYIIYVLIASKQPLTSLYF